MVFVVIMTMVFIVMLIRSRRVQDSTDDQEGREYDSNKENGKASDSVGEIGQMRIRLIVVGGSVCDEFR